MKQRPGEQLSFQREDLRDLHHPRRLPKDGQTGQTGLGAHSEKTGIPHERIRIITD